MCNPMMKHLSRNQDIKDVLQELPDLNGCCLPNVSIDPRMDEIRLLPKISLKPQRMCQSNEMFSQVQT